METIWRRALPILREQVGERNYATWIEPIREIEEDSGLRLEVPSRFFQEWITRQFYGAIRDAVTLANGTPQNVRIVVNAQAMPPSRGPLRAEDRAAPAAAPRPRRPAIGHLVAKYTFDTFVVGESNRMAHDAARAVATEPGKRFNPLFIHGGVGLGKTHLINAIAHEFLDRFPRRRMACLSAETFMNNLIACLRQDQMASFRERYRRVDMLVLDDVQFLAGKERTQEEFFHTFNALQADGKQIVLTSDKAPTDIPGLEQRLRSRFEGGLTADIHPPTLDMRMTILQRKAEAQGLPLPLGVAEYLARRSGSSVRELEGMLTRVIAAADVGGQEISLALAQAALGPFDDPVVHVSLDEVVERVGAEFRIERDDLLAHRRTRGLTHPRQVAMYLCRTLVGASYPAIADKFGGRDHSTVMHAVRAVGVKREADPATASLLARLETALRAQARSADRSPPERRRGPRKS